MEVPVKRRDGRVLLETGVKTLNILHLLFSWYARWDRFFFKLARNYKQNDIMLHKIIPLQVGPEHGFRWNTSASMVVIMNS